MRKIDVLIFIGALTLISTAVYADTMTKNKDVEPKKAVKQKKVMPVVAANPSIAKEEEVPEEDAPLTGSLTFTTNYVFRGLSQSNNLPAVQGSLTYTFIPTGIYFNLWGSNVYFPTADGSTATIELDTIAGITNDVGDHFNYNLAFGRYNYPKAVQANYNEIITNFTLYFLTATFAYSANEFNVHKPGTYTNGGVKFDIPAKYGVLENMTFAATYGHFNLPREAGKSFDDYAVTLSKAVKNYNIALQWTDTNHKYSDNSLDHQQIIGSVTANF